MKFHENMSSGFMKICQAVLSNGVVTKIVSTQRAITPKVGKPELRFLCSAHRLIMFNVCVKFNGNVSRGFKVMEQSRKLSTHKGQ